MPAPELVDGGVLPPGIHDFTPEDVLSVFGQNTERQFLWERFQGFLERVQLVAQMPITIYLDGRFITAWENCRTIDVVIEAREFAGKRAENLKMLCDQQVGQEFLEDFAVVINVVVPGLHADDYRLWFQQIKPEDAWRFGADPEIIKFFRKGIIRLKL